MYDVRSLYCNWYLLYVHYSCLFIVYVCLTTSKQRNVRIKRTQPSTAIISHPSAVSSFHSSHPESHIVSLAPLYLLCAIAPCFLVGLWWIFFHSPLIRNKPLSRHSSPVFVCVPLYTLHAECECVFQSVGSICECLCVFVAFLFVNVASAWNSSP